MHGIGRSNAIIMKKYLLIFGVLAISFFISSYSANNVFLGETPKVNPYYLSNLKNQISVSTTKFANIFKKQPTYDFATLPGALPNNLFKEVATGVAAHDREDGGVDYRIQPGTKITIKDFTLPDGTVVKGIQIGE